jgi:phosphate transport system permease protein
MLYQLVSKSSALELRDLLLEDLSLIGKTQQVWLLASSDVDMYLKGKFPKDTPEHRRKLKDKQLEWVHALKGYHSIKYRFNKYFFTSGDSRSPEIAGILGSIMGSFFIVVVCMLVAFPIGVLSAIYLEEFAPKNRLTEFIEININNLAAVPSIVFGLLGLSIYIQVFGLPRSASFVGGLTLALMALPVIVISTRTAIRAIPQSIKDGAIALGASKMQTTLHHVLPLAMPGIMTGSILSVARILGETAPLLMIGMVAFIVDIPQNWFDAATAMPVQIYLWADSPESGFVEKTSAAILVLLVMLAAINAIAVIVRKKFEKRW